MITWADFEKIDIRVGTILEAKEFPKAKNPAYQLTIDFGELGIKKSSAQITQLYDKAALIDTQVIAVVNFPPKQIANFKSWQNPGELRSNLLVLPHDNYRQDCI